MSVLYSDDEGWCISHTQYISELYNTIPTNLDDCHHAKFYSHFFHIDNPFVRDSQKAPLVIAGNSKKRKRKQLVLEDDDLRTKISSYLLKLKIQTKIFLRTLDQSNNNLCARQASVEFYEKTSELNKCFGENQNPSLHISNKYIFPPLCKFFCDDITKLSKLQNTNYDLILMDPPWTNKYIKRKKKIKLNEGYTMIQDDDLKKLPIGELLAPGGLVCVWCTNAQNHIDSLKHAFFPAWNVTYVSTWYWVKVTNCGELVCNFTPPPGKQPYERIIFGRKCDGEMTFKNPEDNKLIVSVPSSVHSHKPPLTDVLIAYLPDKPNCLELFARYLLPKWTSYGLEVLKFQHLFLYDNFISNKCKKIK